MEARNGGRIASNLVEPGEISFKVTGAADVNANGYTVNEGTEFVSSVTKTAEGKAKIALTSPFPQFKGLYLELGAADYSWYLESAADIATLADPHIHVVFRSIAATPADKDPDSVVWRGTLCVNRTGLV